MRIVVTGGTGHVGSFLVPRLVLEGHDVAAVSRGQRTPYTDGPVWSTVKRITMDRPEAEKSGEWVRRIVDFKPDIVMDLICYTPESNQMMYEALKGRIRHFLQCGTAWVYGPTHYAPADEQAPRCAAEAYGRQKAEIEAFLLEKERLEGFPATMIHPGHIVGPGWVPINPVGNLNVSVYQKLARGERLVLPDFGLAMLHHVHADDVAQVFCRAMHLPSASIGESFNSVSAAALTLLGYARFVARLFGKEADLDFKPWAEWKKDVSEQDAAATFDHISKCPVVSIEKARRLLAFQPRYTSQEAIQESLLWLVQNGKL